MSILNIVILILSILILSFILYKLLQPKEKFSRNITQSANIDISKVDVSKCYLELKGDRYKDFVNLYTQYTSSNDQVEAIKMLVITGIHINWYPDYNNYGGDHPPIDNQVQYGVEDLLYTEDKQSIPVDIYTLAVGGTYEIVVGGTVSDEYKPLNPTILYTAGNNYCWFSVQDIEKIEKGESIKDEKPSTLETIQTGIEVAERIYQILSREIAGFGMVVSDHIPVPKPEYAVPCDIVPDNIRIIGKTFDNGSYRFLPQTPYLVGSEDGPPILIIGYPTKPCYKDDWGNMCEYLSAYSSYKGHDPCCKASSTNTFCYDEVYSFGIWNTLYSPDMIAHGNISRFGKDQQCSTNKIFLYNYVAFLNEPGYNPIAVTKFTGESSSQQATYNDIFTTIFEFGTSGDTSSIDILIYAENVVSFATYGVYDNTDSRGRANLIFSRDSTGFSLKVYGTDFVIASSNSDIDSIGYGREISETTYCDHTYIDEYHIIIPPVGTIFTSKTDLTPKLFNMKNYATLLMTDGWTQTSWFSPWTVGANILTLNNFYISPPKDNCNHHRLILYSYSYNCQQVNTFTGETSGGLYPTYTDQYKTIFEWGSTSADSNIKFLIYTENNVSIPGVCYDKSAGYGRANLSFDSFFRSLTNSKNVNIFDDVGYGVLVQIFCGDVQHWIDEYHVIVPPVGSKFTTLVKDNKNSPNMLPTYSPDSWF